MVDRGGGLPLAAEPLAEAVVSGELGGQQLQRDWAAERELRGAIDDAHAATTGDGLDAIAGKLTAGGECGGGGVHALSDAPRRAVYSASLVT